MTGDNPETVVLNWLDQCHFNVIRVDSC